MNDLRWAALLMLSAVMVGYSYARVKQAEAEPGVEQISGGASGTGGIGGSAGSGVAGSAGIGGAAGSAGAGGVGGAAGVGIHLD